MSITREDVLTASDVAALLDLKPYTVKEYARRGILPGTKARPHLAIPPARARRGDQTPAAGRRTRRERVPASRRPAALLLMAAHIMVAGDPNGESVVAEVFADGRLVIRRETSRAAIRGWEGLEPISRAEYEQAFGDVPSDDEGWCRQQVAAPGSACASTSLRSRAGSRPRNARGSRGRTGRRRPGRS